MATDEVKARRPATSVFVKVLVTLAVMALLIIAVVATFIHTFYGSRISAPVERVIRSHVETLASEMGDRPEVSAARRLAAPGGFEVRYEGRGGSWATSDDLPGIAQARAALDGPHRLRPWLFNRDYLVDRPGGSFLFRWRFGWAAGVHDEMLVSVLLLIVVFVVGAHLAIRNYLRPIRTLREGVGRLADGDFSVQVAVSGSDELATLSRAFNGMITRIGDMVKARDQLLTDVSHELRSPITRMKLALEFIPEDEKKRSLETDLREMETMVVELLEIERLKDGRGGLQLETADLAALVVEVAGGQDRPPGIRVCAGAAPPLPVTMDRRRMRVVLKNLLDNALKYSPPGGRAVEVTVERDRATAVVRVSDDGPGVPEDEIDRVFDPFYRVDRSRSKETGGYGLGLSMCRRIAEAHGGTVTLVNNEAGGATAILTLPVTGQQVTRV